ncbi:hypothetical protein EYF80_002695 [Liparis tanakae]|uniref:Uncharacterized protein n=1 Tax=Liparis tanakae TaxID=230148 RepID=A0A4Z2JA06_9TELE|nr:hypothetical protein EYF80_002695 [Liparis tanakae]
MERGLPCSWTHAAPPSWSDVTPKPLLSTGLRAHTPPLSPPTDPLGVIETRVGQATESSLKHSRHTERQRLVLRVESSAPDLSVKLKEKMWESSFVASVWTYISGERISKKKRKEICGKQRKGKETLGDRDCPSLFLITAELQSAWRHRNRPSRQLGRPDSGEEDWW